MALRKHYFSKKNTLHSNKFTVGFYNLENLFDTKDDPATLDNSFLPEAEKNWTQKRYEKKIFKLGTAISNIGFRATAKAPTILGLAEVENAKVVQDLIASKHLKNKKYGMVHFDSPDERGIDVALIYQKEYFKVAHKEAIAVEIVDADGEKDFTRDILYVNGFLNEEKIHLLVNHWPSRRDGAESTAYKRIAAAEKNRVLIAQIKEAEGEDVKIIVMGDFNDDPSNKSVQHLKMPDLYNPMEKLLTKYEGSLSYRGNWNLFDQILFSNNFHRYQNNTHSFSNATIFDDQFLKIFRGRYKGTPFRTYVGNRYKGGYSDHFPVYITLQLNKM